MDGDAEGGVQRCCPVATNDLVGEDLVANEVERCFEGSRSRLSSAP
jgi:hypothetical protein